MEKLFSPGIPSNPNISDKLPTNDHRDVFIYQNSAEMIKTLVLK